MTKERLFQIIQIGEKSDFISKAFDILILSSIMINVIISILLTFDISDSYRRVIYIIEFITVVFFTFEYILRLSTAAYLYKDRTKLKASLTYMFSFSGLVDFFSFFPFYLPYFFSTGAVVFRLFRVVRILRLFNVNPYSNSLTIIGKVVRSKRTQLISSVFIVFILMTASSILMYNVEHPVQPEVFKNAFSGFWWAGSTLLTIGYGDIYPITYLGRTLGIIIAFLGVGLVAIPTGILSAGFVSQTSEAKSKEKANYCPNCGKKI